MTGAIHWDGLIDTADALGAPKKRRLAVLKDVHAGSFGILALVFVLACQWSTLSALSGWYHGAALLLFPVWGRWLMVAVSWNMPDMRQGGGLAGSFLARLSGRQVVASGAVSTLVSVLLLGVFGGVVLLLVMGALAWGLRQFYRRQFDGVSGDLIGTACCLGEVVALLTLSALA
jgi:adenosylcobinamide-GDP ribazoletransferase